MWYFFVFFNESLEYWRRNDLSSMNNYAESIFVDVSPHPLTQNKCVTLGVLYRPPNTDVRNFLENMSTILANLKGINRTAYIMGIFHLNLINISEHIPTSDFVELMFSYSFFPLINKPTRLTETSATLIDNIFCNSIDKAESLMK